MIDEREDQLLTCIPDVLDYKSILYIGASRYRRQMLHLFIDKGYDYSILEIWKPYINWMRKHFKNIIEGDVRNVDDLKLGSFDIVMWWHGPEHIMENELVSTLDKLGDMTKKILITANPWGIYESGPQRGNPYEAHLSHLYPEFFNKLGWETDTIGEKNVPKSNLLSWQRKQ